VALTLAGCGADEAVNPLGGAGGSAGSSGDGGAAGGASGEGGAGGTAGSGGDGGAGGAQGGMSFVEAGRYPAPVGAGNEAVAQDDMNGDGVPDLVVLNALNTGFEARFHPFISIQIGDGDGTFQRIDAPLPGNYYVRAFATADVNGDGVRDVIVGTLADSQEVAAVLLGNGDGTLQPAVPYDSLYSPYSVAPADIDGDGDIDLVLGSSSDRIVLLRGNGDGTFQPPVFVDVAGSNGLVAVAVGDLDGDDLLDIVAADRTMNQLRVLQGTGGGAFQVLPPVPAQRSTSIALGDLTGDGRPEVLLGAGYGSTGIGVLLNDGSGALQGFTAYPAGQAPSAPRVADVDGDGAADVVAVSRVDSAAYVLRNAGGGALEPAIAHPGGDGGVGAEVADFNGDAAADLAIVNQEPGLVVLPGQGGGAFGAPIEQRLGAGARAVTLADLDGDGASDIAFASRFRSSVNVLRGIGAGAFAPAVGYPVDSDPFKLVAGHFDAGATVDLAAGVASDCYPCPGVEMLAGDGDGALLPPVVWAEDIFLDIAAGDFNGDGLTDVAAAVNGDGLLANLLLAQGDGTASLGDLPRVATVLAAGDFDGDGFQDLAAAEFGLGFLLRGNGDGTFQEPPQFNFEDRADQRATGDFNSDGYLDYVGAGSKLGLALSTGDGVTFTRVSFHLNLGPLGSPAPADFDGDGWLDLALIAGDRVVVLWNARGTFVAGPLLTPGGASSVAAGDLDGDGRPDLAVTSYVRNDVAILLNKTM
jgi:hypothetical protein